MKTKKKSMRLGLRTLCVAGFVSSLVGCALETQGDFAEESSVSSRELAVTNGFTTQNNRGSVIIFMVGDPNPCSGVLVRDQWVLTAQHCLNEDALPAAPAAPPWEFRISADTNPGQTPPANSVTPTQIIVHPDSSVDLALVRVPPGLGTRTILSNRDSIWHDTVLALGYGQNSTTGGGKGTLRYGQLNGFTLANGQIQLDKNWRDQLTDHGDSGGPSLIHLDHFGRYGWSIVGIHVQRPTNSYSIDEGVAANRGWIKRTISARGDFNGDGMSDIALVGGQGWGSVPIATSNGDGSFGIENHSLSSFPGWASTSGVQKLSGDFNGDGLADVALTGGSGWQSLPVALSNGDGTFQRHTSALAQFPAWASLSGAQAITGDFDGDGYDDVALTGVSGWGSLPIAFSKGDGGFVVSNTPLAEFPALAAQSNVTAIPGDYDGDGRTDVALVGGQGWTDIPIAFSNGYGTFMVRHVSDDGFLNWANQPSAYAVGGDFDGDGRDDIALLGSSLSLLPIAYSVAVSEGFAFDASYHTMSQSLFTSDWAKRSGVKAVVGDMDGNGKCDIALTGTSGWGTVPIAMNDGSGPTRVENKALVNFPVWAATAGAMPVSWRASK